MATINCPKRNWNYYRTQYQINIVLDFRKFVEDIAIIENEGPKLTKTGLVSLIHYDTVLFLSETLSSTWCLTQQRPPLPLRYFIPMRCSCHFLGFSQAAYVQAGTADLRHYYMKSCKFLFHEKRNLWKFIDRESSFLNLKVIKITRMRFCKTYSWRQVRGKTVSR